jgi:hypothetical protein
MFHAMVDLTLARRFYDLVAGKHPDLAALNILISFDNFKGQHELLKQLQAAKMIAATFLDAGTYGKNIRGANPALQDLFHVYLSWIYMIGEDFDYISSYDDRFNEPVHNWLNYQDLKEELDQHDAEHGTALARKLVPVIHSPDTDEVDDETDDDTPAEEFLSYIEEGATTIGIGSKPMLGKKSMRELQALSREHNVRIHRFGNFDYEFIQTWEIDSADSGRFFRSRQYGVDAWFWSPDSEKKLVRWPVRDKLLPDEFRATLHDVFGWDRDDLLADAEKIWMVNLFAHQQAQAFLTEKFALK